jgi:hypothetical protein
MTAAIQATAENTGSGTSATGNKPTGVSSGDLMIAVVTIDTAVDPPPPTITPPAGWTLIQEAYFDYQYGVMVGVYYRIAGGSEPSSWNWTISPSDQWLTVLLRISGHDGADPINASAQTSPSASTDQPPAPSVTTTVDDCLILYVAGMDKDCTPFTPPSGCAEVWDFVSSGEVCSSGATKTQASAGATGEGVFTATISPNENWATVTVAIAPAAGAAGISIPVVVHHLRQQGIA